MSTRRILNKSHAYRNQSVSAEFLRDVAAAAPGSGSVPEICNNRLYIAVLTNRVASAFGGLSCWAAQGISAFPFNALKVLKIVFQMKSENYIMRLVWRVETTRDTCVG